MKTAIFDLDGTLVDLFDAHLGGFEHIMDRELGLKFKPEDLMKHYGRTGEQIIEAFIKKKGADPAPYHTLAKKRREWVIKHLEGVKVLSGVCELLKDLSDSGFGLAIATSNTMDMGSKILEKAGLSNSFQACAYKDDSIAGKPAGDIFLKAARMMGSDPWDCVAFEDSVYGVLAAKNAKMRVIATCTGAHQRRELGLLCPDLLVDDLTQVNAKRIKTLFE